MQIQRRTKPLVGLLQELGQWRRHSGLKRGSVSLESGGEEKCLQLNCDVGFTDQCCLGFEEVFSKSSYPSNVKNTSAVQHSDT